MLLWLRLLVFIIILMPSLASADCFHNGQRYPEGARIGILVCEGGQWVAKP